MTMYKLFILILEYVPDGVERQFLTFEYGVFFPDLVNLMGIGRRISDVFAQIPLLLDEL